MKNTALRIAGTIFGIVAILHLSRLVTGAPVYINGWLLPVWSNWIGMIATTFLCMWCWRLSVDKT